MVAKQSGEVHQIIWKPPTSKGQANKFSFVYLMVQLMFWFIMLQSYWKLAAVSFFCVHKVTLVFWFSFIKRIIVVLFIASFVSFPLGAFEDPDIIHVDDTVDPVRDLEVISAELRLKVCY